MYGSQVELKIGKVIAHYILTNLEEVIYAANLDRSHNHAFLISQLLRYSL